MKYMIIGFGCAGYYAAKTIRENDPDGTITVFSDHDSPPYNPMLTTYYVAGKIPFESMFPFGDTEKIASELSLDLRQGVKVAKVNAKNREVVLEDGSRESFDRLLIATGASAFSPRFDGLDPTEAFFMRTLDDARRLKDELDNAGHRKALVVGASMVGIKVVELLVARGIDTTLADMAAKMFPLAAYDDVAAEIGRRIEKKGVHLALGSALKSAEKKDDGYICHMSDGSDVKADLIVLCIGTRANVSVVDSDEIKVNRAIVVDDRMETTVPGIYAAGDCCEGHELQSDQTMIIGLWANAAHQGTTAGANMAGAETEFDGNFMHNITHFMDIYFIGIGDNRAIGEMVTYGDIKGPLFVKAVQQKGCLNSVES